MSSTPVTPALDKFDAMHREYSGAVSFIDWLLDRGLGIATYIPDEGIVAVRNVDSLLYQWLEIDPEILERDRRALAEWEQADRRGR